MVNLIWLVLGLIVVIFIFLMLIVGLNALVDYVFGAQHVARHNEAYPPAPKVRS